jgi:hypothetical protein
MRLPRSFLNKTGPVRAKESGVSKVRVERTAVKERLFNRRGCSTFVLDRMPAEG